jgi:hypothetical protein
MLVVVRIGITEYEGEGTKNVKVSVKIILYS